MDFLLADVGTGSGGLDEDDLDDPGCTAALAWQGDHLLDFCYLRDPPRSLWWRTGDEITPVWSHKDDPPVRETVSANAFTTALIDLDRELMAAMDQRVRRAETGNAPSGAQIDVPGLRREHGNRSRWLQHSLARGRHTDWAAVRAGARRLLS